MIDGIEMTKEEYAISLLKNKVSHRDIVFSVNQKYGEGISHSKLSKWEKDMRSGIDPITGDHGSNVDPKVISKLQELISLLKAKKEEQQIAIKQLLRFFVAISTELDTIGKDSNKLTINQDRFNQMIDEILDTKIIDKYEFLLKE